METSYDSLIAWIANALKDEEISDPSLDDVFWFVMHSQIIKHLWTQVFGVVSPLALDDRISTKLISDLVYLYHWKLDQIGPIRLLDPSFDQAVEKREKQVSKQRSKLRKLKNKEIKRKETLDFIAKNPRKYGNGKWDETYPEYYNCFQKRGQG